MVTSNRSGGGDAPHWWDDLPPQMRGRFTHPLAEPEEPQWPAEPPAPIGRGELLSGLSLLVTLFALVALGHILFLSAALYFVYR